MNKDEYYMELSPKEFSKNYPNDSKDEESDSTEAQSNTSDT